MPDNSSGVYSLPPVYLAVSGQPIEAQQHNVPLNDLAAAMTARYSRDGRAPMLGNVPMNGYRVVGMAEGENPQDAVTLAQVEQLIDEIPAPFYGGSDPEHLDFPLGSVLPVWRDRYITGGNYAQGVMPDRRAIVTVVVPAFNGAIGGLPRGATIYQQGGAGSALLGTWRSIGGAGEYFHAVRVA